MKRIIIIDDNPVNNEMFIGPLRKKYKVDVVMYLKSLDRMLSRNHYDLIVMDVMMPVQGLNIVDNMTVGYHYFKKVIKFRFPGNKVLFWTRLSEETCSAYDQNLPRETKFLQKNSDRNHLLKKIDEIFND